MESETSELSTNKLVTKSFKWEETALPQLYALIKFEEDSASFSDAMRDFLKKLILDKNAPLSSEPEDSDPEQYNKPLPPQNPFTQRPTNPFIELDKKRALKAGFCNID